MSWERHSKSYKAIKKTEQSAGMIMIFLFWDGQDMVFTNDLQKKRRMSKSKDYVTLTGRLKTEIVKKRTLSCEGRCDITSVGLQ